MTHFFDYLTVLIIGGLAFIGFRRGFLEELSRLIGLIISSLVTLKFYTPVASWLKLRIPLNESILLPITFLFIFFSILIVFRLLLGSFQIFLLSRGIRSSNKILGIFIGGVKGLIVALIILWLVDIAPNPDYFDNFKKHSYVYRHFSGYPKRIAISFGIEGAMKKGETWMKDKLKSQE